MSQLRGFRRPEIAALTSTQPPPQLNFTLPRIPSHPASRARQDTIPRMELKYEVLQADRIKQIVEQLALVKEIHCNNVTIDPKIRMTTLEWMTPFCLEDLRELRLISCGSNLLRHLFYRAGARNLKYFEVEIDEQWTASDLQKLADFIKRQTQLKALKLVNCGCDHAITLDHGVPFQLESLTLESVKLSPQSLPFLEKQIFVKSAKLILSDRSEADSRVLRSILYNNQKIESLELMIHDVDVSISSKIKPHESIKSLTFAEKNPAKGDKQFSRLLSIMPRLTTLHFTCSGTKKHDDHFFNQISRLTDLKALRLRNVSPPALECLHAPFVRDLFYESDIDDYPELIIKFFTEHKKIIRLELAITVDPDFCRRLVDALPELKELTIWDFKDFEGCIAILMFQCLKVVKVPQCHLMQLSERARFKYKLLATKLQIHEEDFPTK